MNQETTIAAALRSTATAAAAYSDAMRKTKDVAWWSGEECQALNAARTVVVGRVTVTATMGGNSRRHHVRHTFKIDGKRASREQVEKMFRD